MTLHPIVRETLRRELAHTARTFLRCAIVMLVVYAGMELLVIWSRA